jgi:hypothetical protein
MAWAHLEGVLPKTTKAQKGRARRSARAGTLPKTRGTLAADGRWRRARSDAPYLRRFGQHALDTAPRISPSLHEARAGRRPGQGDSGDQRPCAPQPAPPSEGGEGVHPPTTRAVRRCARVREPSPSNGTRGETFRAPRRFIRCRRREPVVDPGWAAGASSTQHERLV